jgi:hypothetical protein
MIGSGQEFEQWGSFASDMGDAVGASRSNKIHAAVVAGALLVAGLVGASPAAAAGTTTVFKLTGDANDYITGGGTYGFTANTANFLLYSAPRSIQITVNSRNTSENWTTWFVAPVGQDFVIGKTYDALGVGFADATHGGLLIGGQGRGCSDDAGTFTVLDYAADPGGTVTQFAATFDHHCVGTTASARGSIYYNSTLTTTLPSTFSASAPAEAQIGQSYTVSGVLSSDGAGVGGATVSVKRTSSAGSQTQDVITDPQGNYSLNDSSAVGGSVTYTATFAGDATHDAATAFTTVKVAFKTPVLSITTNKRSYAYGTTALVTIHLGPTHTLRTVWLYAFRAGISSLQPGKAIAHLRVNAKGLVEVKYAMTHLTTFTARFDGDDIYGQRNVAVNRQTSSKLIITMHGYSAKRGSTYVYGQVNPTLTTLVLPRRSGYCVQLPSQVRRSGTGWFAGPSLGCDATDLQSIAYAIYRGHSRGEIVRVRASIDVSTFAGSGASAWVYFTFK